MDSMQASDHSSQTGVAWEEREKLAAVEALPATAANTKTPAVTIWNLNGSKLVPIKCHLRADLCTYPTALPAQ